MEKVVTISASAMAGCRSLAPANRYWFREPSCPSKNPAGDSLARLRTASRDFGRFRPARFTDAKHRYRRLIGRSLAPRARFGGVFPRLGDPLWAALREDRRLEVE